MDRWEVIQMLKKPMSQRRERALKLSSGLEYTRVPKRKFKKWSNTVLTIKFRELEKLLIECQKRKDTLGKNAQKVYQKYIDKIKDLNDIIAYLEGLLKLSTDLRQIAEKHRLEEMGTAIGDYLGKVLK